MPQLQLSDYASIAAIAEATIALIVVIALYFELRGSRKAASTEASLAFYQMWLSKEMSENVSYEYYLNWDSYDDWKAKYDLDVRARTATTNIRNFFEMLAVACRYGTLDTVIAHEFFASIVVHYWDRYEEWTSQRREAEGRTTSVENFEWLAKLCRTRLEDP